MLYSKSELTKAFFFDVETVSQYPSFVDFQKAEPEKADIWLRKLYFKSLEREVKFLEEQYTLTNDSKWTDLVDNLSSDRVFSFDYIYVKYAALYPEFGRVAVLSAGVIGSSEKVVPGAGAISSLFDSDEKQLLIKAVKLLTEFSAYTLAGFNIVTFDIPFLIKRMLIHRIAIPSLFALRGKKPWEIQIMDVMKDYQGLSYEPITLDLLCHTLGVKTPKDLVQNYQVSIKFHSGELTIEQMTQYCEKDVRALIDLAIALSK